MKIMIDRCLPRYTEIINKKFYYIVTAANPEHFAADAVVEGFKGFLRCLPDSEKCGIIYGTGTWDKEDVFKHPSTNEVYEVGKIYKITL